MTSTTISWESETVTIAGTALHVAHGGSGAPVLVLHHDIGTPERLPFYDALARHFTLIVPSHPGYDRSQRPDWIRNVRDVAVVYQWLLAEREATWSLSEDRGAPRVPRGAPSVGGMGGHFGAPHLGDAGQVTLVGLGFGGWIAAEMATMAPRAFRRLVLVGAMGIKPERGEIADQALVSYIDYVRRGFADQAAFDRIFGADPPTPTLSQWDLNREMTFRIAWKPYMYNPTLPHLLGGVATPALVVWGRDDRIVPLECGERYAKSLPHARLQIVDGAGHLVEMEKPDVLAALITQFVTSA